MFCYRWDSMRVCLGLRILLRLTMETVLRLSLWWKRLKCSFPKHTVDPAACATWPPRVETADWKPDLAGSAVFGPLLWFAQLLLGVD